jgi:hypothetical protein
VAIAPESFGRRAKVASAVGPFHQLGHESGYGVRKVLPTREAVRLRPPEDETVSSQSASVAQVLGNPHDRTIRDEDGWGTALAHPKGDLGDQPERRTNHADPLGY